MTLAEFKSLLDSRDCKPTGEKEIAARCPAHEDNRASLCIGEASDGKLLVCCQAGCKTEDICAKLGCTLADLFPARPASNGGKEIIATYDYTEASGKLLFQVCRFQPKDFRQRRPDGNGGWLWNLQGVSRVLYRLPEITRDVAKGLPVFVVEGEKDVAALVAQGFSATCNSGGAGKWLAGYSETLRGAVVVVIADKDAPGRKHAQDVAAKLQGVAASVRVLELPDVAGKPVKDAADYFSAGGEVGQLQDLVDAAPAWTPTATETSLVASAASNLDATEFDKFTGELRGEILATLTNANASTTEQRRTIAGLVVSALCRIGAFYFHAERRDYDSAMFFNAHEKRLLRVRADAFTAWLSDWLRINRADTLFKYILAEIETAAVAGKQTTGILPEAFWAARPGAIYLSNGDGSAVKVTAAGVATVDNGADGILFAAGRTLTPWALTTPRDIFETCTLFRNTHTSAGHAPDLLRLWVYSLPSNPRSKPPVCATGDVGSGKTRTAKGIAEFYGLPFVAAKVEESKEDDFWPCCDAGGLFTLDNADTRCRWLADAVANAATDGCSQRRRKYTDSETVILRPRAWLLITTANPSFASDSGLADRLLVVRMARRETESSDSALTDEILAARDAGLSHVAVTLQKALADTGATPTGLNARHPDWASLAVKIGRALGREAQAVAALRAAESDKSQFCLENDSVAAALLAYLAKAGTFSGTAAELAPHLVETDSDLLDRLSAKRLGKRLAALWPHLEKALPVCRRENTRACVALFTFKASESAGFAGFQTVFS